MEYEVIEEMRKEELRIVNEKYDEMLYLAEEKMLYNTKRVNKKYNKMHRKKSADEDSIVVDLDTDTDDDGLCIDIDDVCPPSIIHAAATVETYTDAKEACKQPSKKKCSTNSKQTINKEDDNMSCSTDSKAITM